MNQVPRFHDRLMRTMTHARQSVGGSLMRRLLVILAHRTDLAEALWHTPCWSSG
jgi:hypothetical protein